MTNNINRKQVYNVIKKPIKYIFIIIGIFATSFIASLALNYSGLFSWNKIIQQPSSEGSEYGNFNSSTNLAYSYRHERLKSALSVLDNINENIDPCDDFYQFACGTFMKSREINPKIPADRFVSTYIDIYTKLHDIIIEIDEQNTIKPFRLVKNLFDICMNTTAIESLGVTPLNEIINKFGGWPTTKNSRWNDSSFTWEKLIYDLYEDGIPTTCFLSLSIDQDIKNNTNMIIEVGHPEYEFDYDVFSQGMNNSRYRDYVYYMSDIFRILDTNTTEENVTNEFLNIIEFETDLSKILTKITTPSKSEMTINDLAKRWPTINWDKLINKTLGVYVNLDGTEKVIIQSTSFLDQFVEIINSAEKHTLKNFALWHVIKFSVPYLNKEIRQISNNYKHRTKNDKSRKICLRSVKKKLQHGVDALYVRKHVNENVKKHVDKMVENIKNRMIEAFRKIEWLDEETRMSAINKARATLSIVGYSDELLDDKILTDYYDELELGKSNYLQSILNIKIFQHKKIFRIFKSPINRTDWTNIHSFFDVNAINMIQSNAIEILGGIVQNAFFNIDRASYLNYGSIGTIIGHEFFHSFDNEGRYFDKNGNLFNWWSLDAEKKFLEKADCLINQYNNYAIHDNVDSKVDGNQTLGENIADNSGTRIAYLAYKDWVEMHGSELALPELPYTSNQLFWISYGNLWCTLDQNGDDSHSPNHVRIRGSLENIPEFAEDFKCKLGSKMNPKNKCILW